MSDATEIQPLEAKDREIAPGVTVADLADLLAERLAVDEEFQTAIRRGDLDRRADQFSADVGASFGEGIRDGINDWVRATQFGEAAAPLGREMTPEKAEQLREPFAAEQIGKLPRITCPACRKDSRKVCNDHTKQRCDECQNYMTTQHIHLDYVGHAAATDRLLRVDPYWTWEPVAWDPTGLPMIQRGEKVARLWIRLTICGVTRLGCGSCDSGKDDVEKELIGDAIRNAAMRFGVALDLWAKENLHADAEAQADTAAQDAHERTQDAEPTGETPDEFNARVGEVRVRVDALTDEQRGTFNDWRAARNFPWPWPKAVTISMHQEIDRIVGTPPDGPTPEEPGRQPTRPQEQPEPGPGPEGPETPTDPVRAGEHADGEPIPADSVCELCGSKRAALANVRGVIRCQNAHDCRKRVEKANEAEPDTRPAPLGTPDLTPVEPTQEQVEAISGSSYTHPVDESEAQDETGDEVLYCSNAECRLVINVEDGELPVFGEAEEPYHVSCAPAFQDGGVL